MIIKSLVDYYNKENKQGNMPEFGFSNEKIGAICILNVTDEKEIIPDIIPMYNEETLSSGKKIRKPTLKTVPLTPVRSSNISPGFLCDNIDYVFGIGEKNSYEKNKKFIEFHNELLSDTEDEDIKIFLAFINNVPENVKEEFKRCFEEHKIQNKIIFAVHTYDNLLHEKEIVKKIWLSYFSSSISREWKEGICSITGEKTKIPLVHDKIKGIKGSQASGASLISFLPESFNSFGKEQCENSSVGFESSFKYTQALNFLLRNPDNFKTIGDCTIIFWSNEEPKTVSLFNGMFYSKEDQLSEELKMYFTDIMAGKYPKNLNLKGKFNVLGITPNGGRLSVIFFYTSSIEDFHHNIKRYFDDLSVIRGEYFSLWQLMSSLYKNIKDENNKGQLSSLVTKLLRSMLFNSPFPIELLVKPIRRIKAEANESIFKRMSDKRVSGIKAYLTRYYKEKEKIPMSLDEHNKDINYILGRLFSVLDRAYYEEGKNQTLSSKYLSSAMTAPAKTFPGVIRLVSHSEGYKYHIKLISELTNSINTWPTTLDIHEQGMFILGYYHQLYNFINRTKEKENKNEQ